jgi:UDP-glucose 4-epimerase
LKTFLVTGGAGYVGSHVAVALMAAGYRIVILDDFSNAAEDAVDRIDQIGPGRAMLVRGDVRDEAALDVAVGAALGGQPIDAVVHLAGPKPAGDPDPDPERHAALEVGGTTAILAAMRRHGVRRLVFSSSASVYGLPAIVPIPEDAPLAPADPYAAGKRAAEGLLDDLVRSDPGFAAISLRYFTPAGAHPSGLIGEAPTGAPGNLLSDIARTASGLSEQVRIPGDDYPTGDGTGIRDYLHVMDVAEGHLAALRHLLAAEAAPGRHRAVNLGTGQGISMLEALAAFRRVVGFEIPFRIVGRRPGEGPVLVADPGRAAALLGWRARRGIEEICADLWTFHRRRLAEPGARRQGAGGR